MKIFNRTYYFWLGLCLLLFYACSSTKNLPPGDALYTGAKITIKEDSLSHMSRKKRRALDGQLEGLTRPEPNSKFLGIPLKLYIKWYAL